MVRIQYFALIILVVFFVQYVTAVTDEQFEDLRSVVDALKNENIELRSIVNELKKENKELKKAEARQNMTIEERVSLLEMQVSEIEQDVIGLEQESADQETRIVGAEENIQGLQATNVNHDVRITALEESDCAGSNGNGTIAFYAVTGVSTLFIEENTPVIFPDILVNYGNGYNNTAGVFTILPGGDGLYYFSTYLLVASDEFAYFNMMVNDDVICTAHGDGLTGGDIPTATCSALADVVEGDELKLIYDFGTDDTPLGSGSTGLYHGFSGFKISTSVLNTPDVDFNKYV